jgi:AraC-like DNA-binding protein
MVTVQRHDGEHGRQAYKRLGPSPDLSEYVRSYEYWESVRGDDTPRPFAVSVLPLLTFYVGARCTAFEYPLRRARVLPPAVAIGPCDHRVADVMYIGHVMRVVFQPTGFFRLFHVSPWEIRNHAYEAVEVLGRPIGDLQSRLSELACPEQMVEATEQMLRSWRGNAWSRSGIHQAAETLLHFKGRSNLFAIARSIGFSERSWRRHFITQVGVAPKRYLRMLRFQHAVALKLNYPNRQWTQICLESGYYDQSHFIADCQAIAGAAPSNFMRELGQMPAATADALYGQATTIL